VYSSKSILRKLIYYCLQTGIRVLEKNTNTSRQRIGDKTLLFRCCDQLGGCPSWLKPSVCCLRETLGSRHISEPSHVINPSKCTKLLPDDCGTHINTYINVVLYVEQYHSTPIASKICVATFSSLGRQGSKVLPSFGP
jgi:hypothetical protein